MNYTVLEIKTTSGTTSYIDPVAYPSKDTAENAYHSLCADASISNAENDTVLLIKEDGVVIKRENYKHDIT